MPIQITHWTTSIERPQNVTFEYQTFTISRFMQRRMQKSLLLPSNRDSRFVHLISVSRRTELDCSRLQAYSVSMLKQQLLYGCSQPGEDIISERPPIYFHLGAKLKAALLNRGLDWHPPEVVPSSVGDFLWASFLYDDPSNPTGLRLIPKRVSGPR